MGSVMTWIVRPVEDVGSQIRGGCGGSEICRDPHVDWMWVRL